MFERVVKFPAHEFVPVPGGGVVSVRLKQLAVGITLQVFFAVAWWSLSCLLTRMSLPVCELFDFPDVLGVVL